VPRGVRGTAGGPAGDRRKLMGVQLAQNAVDSYRPPREGSWSTAHREAHVRSKTEVWSKKFRTCSGWRPATGAPCGQRRCHGSPEMRMTATPDRRVRKPKRECRPRSPALPRVLASGAYRPPPGERIGSSVLSSTTAVTQHQTLGYQTQQQAHPCLPRHCGSFSSGSCCGQKSARSS
jgi:hypothetical protein